MYQIHPTSFNSRVPEPLHPTSFNSTILEPHQQKIRKQRILAASAIALIATAVIYNLTQFSAGSNASSDLHISTMTPEQNTCDCENFVKGITTIGGISEQEISEFAKKQGVFGSRTLRDKLFQDCMIGKKMGTTHDELADHLEKVLSAGGASRIISYNPALQANSTIGKYSQTQSIKYGDDIVASNCVPVGMNIFKDNVFACPDPQIQNLYNHVHIRISDRIIARVREGFYDGFSPLDVGAILTGHSVDSVRQAIGTAMQPDETNNVLSSIVVGEKK